MFGRYFKEYNLEANKPRLFSRLCLSYLYTNVDNRYCEHFKVGPMRIKTYVKI